MYSSARVWARPRTKIQVYSSDRARVRARAKCIPVLGLRVLQG